MAPSVSVMWTASRAMVTFSTCADFAGSIAGAESAFQTAAAEAGSGVCAAVRIGARTIAIAKSFVLRNMLDPTGWLESSVPDSEPQVTSSVHFQSQPVGSNMFLKTK